MGVESAEVLTNLAMAAFAARQYDLFWPCFDRALSCADSEHTADIWYETFN